MSFKDDRLMLLKFHNTIIQRCVYTNADMYCEYGAKGISVCKSWTSFTNFFIWSINNGYKEGLSIDRKDKDGNYEPNNCQWIALKADISKKTRLIKKDKDDIVFLYLKSNLLVKNIALNFSINVSRIYQILKDYKIQTRRTKCIQKQF